MDIYFYYRVSYLHVDISDIKEKEKEIPSCQLKTLVV